jgi:predicted ATPase/DNA-binding SARP family transcriptional activator
MELLVLGSLDLVADGAPVVLRAPKQRRLLAALAVARGQPLSADELIDAVWGVSPPPSARKLLHVYASQLRKSLRDGVRLVTSPGGYALDVDTDSFDAARFERLLAEGRRALRGENAALADSLLTRARALWRGAAYAEVAYDDFARAEAERLEELRLAALEEWAEARLRLGRHHELAADLIAAAGEHPLRERLQELAMVALYRSGRQSEALELYAATRRRLRHELGLEPRQELRELQRRILRQDPGLDLEAPMAAPRSRLPAPPNALIGRERELADVRSMLARDDVRLLTLTGAGGSGKTRIALELARELEPAFANGAVFVPLAPLADSRFVLPVIARTIGVDDPTGRTTLDSLAAALEPQELLLVLDNAEHLRQAAPVYAELVARAPRLRMVITSRCVLHLSGEHVYPVHPLPEDDAVELFRVRARALDPAFELTHEVEGDVRETCRRVDFLPLGVELAAGRIRTLMPRALQERLTRRLAVLTGGPRDLPARQQTLRATLDWSIDLLEPDERQALARLSVFAGGCNADAAETVCGADIDALSALVDHNLVRRADAAGEPRFLLLETIREYATERLGEAGEIAELRDLHAEWCLALAEKAEPHLTGTDQTHWFATLETERDNLRAALLHLGASDEVEKQLRLTIALSRYWYVRGHLAQARGWLEHALTASDVSLGDLHRRALTASAAVCLLQGDYAAATSFAEQALAAARAGDDPRYVANGLSNLGAIVLAGGDHARAGGLLEEAVALAREVGDTRIAALAINNLGDLALTVGDYERAGPLFEESLELLRARGDTSNVARALFNLGAVALRRDRLDEAFERLRESLPLASAAGDMEDLAWCLEGVAAAAAAVGKGEEAAVLLGAAGALLQAIGAEFKPFERQLHDSTESAVRRLCGVAGFEAATAAGAALDESQAAERALALLA